MSRQRKIATNLGKDTLVRNYQGNQFKQQASKTYQMIAGEIKETEPEPLYRQTMVTVALARLGEVTSVAYPNAFIDPESGNLHGLHEGPIPGQMVAVGFENGDRNNPFVVNRYPYQGKGNTDNEPAYINPIINAGFDVEDVLLGHKSGSYLSFNTGILSGKDPGSATLTVAMGFELLSGETIAITSEIDTNITGENIILAGNTEIQLNGDTNYAVLYNELKTAFDQLKTDHDAFLSHIHITTATVGLAPAGVISPAAGYSPSTADMSTSKNSTVRM